MLEPRTFQKGLPQAAMGLLFFIFCLILFLSVIPLSVLATGEEKEVESIEYKTDKNYQIPDTPDKNGFYDYTFDFFNGDRLIVHYKDKTTKEFYYDREDGWDTGDLPSNITIGHDQAVKKWNIKTPENNYIYAEYMGVKSNHIPVFLKLDLTKAKVKLASTTVTYTGKIISAPAVVSVTLNGKTLKKGRDYKASIGYGNRKCIGDSDYWLIEGQGDYLGNVSASFRIVPKGTRVLKASASRKAITVTLKKQDSRMAAVNKASYKKRAITGYQVQLSTKKSFPGKGLKSYTFKGYKNTRHKLGKLAAKKKYYIRVRTYMKVGSSNLYSKWTVRKKAVKTR